MEKYAWSGLGVVATEFCPNDVVCSNVNPSKIFIDTDNLIPKVHVHCRVPGIAQAA